MNPDFPVLLVETPSRHGLAKTGLEELRAALGRAGVSTQMRPAGEDIRPSPSSRTACPRSSTPSAATSLSPP